jgi:clan AA aspartic protease
VIGSVDENNRALLAVTVRAKFNDDPSTVQAWVDTAFDGHFVFSSEVIEALGLETLVETEAILADGNKVTLETFVAFLDWFDELIPVQVVANDGQFPLLGTALLENHRLTIDYNEKTVDLD